VSLDLVRHAGDGLGVDIHYRETALLRFTSYVLRHQNIPRYEVLKCTGWITGQVSDATSFASYAANLPDELWAGDKPDRRSRIAEQWLDLCGEQPSPLGEDGSRPRQPQKVVDDHREAILRALGDGLPRHLVGAAQHPSLIHRHRHEGDEMRLTLGHAAVDMKWFLAIEVVDPQPTPLCQDCSDRRFGGTYRSTDPQDIPQGALQVIRSAHGKLLCAG